MNMQNPKQYTPIRRFYASVGFITIIIIILTLINKALSN